MNEAFTTHLDTVAANWERALAEAGFDSAIVTAGEPRNHFLDDQAPPLQLNPHFMQWCPEPAAHGSALLIRPGEQPRLYFLQPDDYWHLPPELPVWAEAFDTAVFSDREPLLRRIQQDALASANRVALIGESGVDRLDGVAPEDINQASLLADLHFSRAVKTPFELAAMREATAKAVRGHLAARAAFEAGESEFRINTAYITASEQLPAELPYQNIVAMNEHAGVLHYQYYDRTPPAKRHSFLIDAGGSQHGYAADITRTYAAESDGLFAELIDRMDLAQRELIDGIAPGSAYLELHIEMHRRIAGILTDSGLATGPADAVFDSGLTESFLPHGLGHLIGLQTHDVGGQQANREGQQNPPPDRYPMLRMTRILEENMPVTIEPGLYFIPQLLDAIKGTDTGKLLNWAKIDRLMPCGGIRIEDNVVIGADGIENLTRNAFAAQS